MSSGGARREGGGGGDSPIERREADGGGRATEERTVEVRGWHDEPWPVFVRQARGDGAPVLWVHGVPTSSDDWVPFLERAGGIAPDLPGFGRSSKRGDGDFTLRGYGRFPGPLLDALGVDRVRLVVHDWGAAALTWAAANPERVERLVVIGSVPLLPGYRWHRVARLWRTRGVGEVAMGLTTPFGLRRTLPGTLGREAAEHFDQGTQRAILRLYRSAPPECLADAGRDLERLRGIPATVIWGGRDPYLPVGFAHRYGEALGAEVRVFDELGHWLWAEDPAAFEAIVAAVA
jgi:pimeloyl-ACP methyl ester carboxylesterase